MKCPNNHCLSTVLFLKEFKKCCKVTKRLKAFLVIMCSFLFVCLIFSKLHSNCFAIIFKSALLRTRQIRYQYQGPMCCILNFPLVQITSMMKKLEEYEFLVYGESKETISDWHKPALTPLEVKQRVTELQSNIDVLTR